nr:MAG TPA: hypothetical protein [Caudoviricetes sp.]
MSGLKSHSRTRTGDPLITNFSKIDRGHYILDSLG